MFYANISYKDDILNSEVKKIPITMSLEDFDQVCNLPFIEEDDDQPYLEGNDFNFETHGHYLLMYPASRILNPFGIGIIRLNTRLIH